MKTKAHGGKKAMMQTLAGLQQFAKLLYITKTKQHPGSNPTASSFTDPNSRVTPKRLQSQAMPMR